MPARIMILDDDEDILELLSIVLQEEGYEVHKSNLIFQDIADVERFVPDLMFVDLFMGHAQAGWEFLQQLKTHPFTVKIPLILCTAATLTPEQVRFTQRHGIPIVYKPFDLDDLNQRVRKSIDPLVHH
ncbi:MAG: response regulator [Ktedonobacteraceae bacterium]